MAAAGIGESSCSSSALTGDKEDTGEWGCPIIQERVGGPRSMALTAQTAMAPSGDQRSSFSGKASWPCEKNGVEQK